MEQKQNDLMKRDLDRFAQNLTRYEGRKENSLRSLAAGKAEIQKLCELSCGRKYTHAVSHALHK
jgi:hypothetical protein